MARKIVKGQKLSAADKQYILQRSWLQRDLGLTTADLLPEDETDETEGGTEGAYEGSGWTIKTLSTELANRGLPTEGNKPDLIDRLREDDLGE